MTTFPEVFSWLVANEYVKLVKGKPVFTDKARTELGGATPESFLPETSQKSLSAIIPASGDRMTMYMDFIMHCKIPPKARNLQGVEYPLSKATKEGCDAFHDILRRGFNPQYLALTVATYYKSFTGFKKNINNYLATEEWRTDYEAIVQAHSSGQLKEHIKEQTNGPKSRFTAI